MKKLMLTLLTIFFIGCPERDLHVNIQDSPVNIGQNINTKNDQNNKNSINQCIVDCMNRLKKNSSPLDNPYDRCKKGCSEWIK